MDRHALTRETALLALEVAATAYLQDLSVWRRAGWMDFISLDYTTGLPGSSALKSLRELQQRIPLEALPVQRLKSRTDNEGLGSSQEEAGEAEHGKSLMMTRTDGQGGMMVVIAFYGTGKRPRDWDSNFDCVPEEGLHRGFLELTRRFEKESSSAEFRETAAVLGLERLRLLDILEEARHQSSRFRLFLVGYSQGAALMQIWTARRIREGVLREHVQGYGFASPSVRFGSGSQEDRRLPLYHMINSDDLIPRVGAQIHLGHTLMYWAGIPLRRACYAGRFEDADFCQLLDSLAAVDSTLKAHLVSLVLVTGLENLSREESSAAFRKLAEGFYREAANSLTDDLTAFRLRFIRRRIQKNLRAIAPMAYGEGLEIALPDELKELVARLGPVGFASLLRKTLAYPHLLVREPGEGIGAYQYIVTWGFDDLLEAGV